MLGPDRPKSKTITPYLSLIVVWGVFAPSLIYALIMISLGWQNPDFGIGGLKKTFSAENQRVFLYESQTSSKYFAKIGGNYEVLLQPWRNYLAERRRVHKVLRTPSEIATVEAGVLIVPSAVALSEAERAALNDAKRRGVNMLLTWAVGSRDSDGQWAGWGFLEAFDLLVINDRPESKMPPFLQFDAELPISNSLRPSERAGFASVAEKPIVFNAKNSTGTLFYGSEGQFVAGEGSIAYSESSTLGSRSVVFGFAETSWQVKPVPIHQLIDDSLRWLGHEAIAVAANWPRGQRSAFVATFDAGNNADNLKWFAKVFDQKKIPATILVDSELLNDRLNRDLQFEIKHEIGISVDADQAALMDDVQLNTLLSQSLLNFKVVSGSRINSQIAPGIALRGLEQNRQKIESRVQDFAARRSLPFQIVERSQISFDLPLPYQVDQEGQKLSVMSLRRGLPFDLVSNQAVDRSQELKHPFLSTYQAAQLSGGLTVVDFLGTGLQPEVQVTESIGKILTKVTSDGDKAWWTTASRVAKWRRDRSRVKVASKFNGKRMELFVTTEGESQIDEFAVVVFVPQRGLVPKLTATKVGMILPDVQKIDEFYSVLRFKGLRPGDLGYIVTFN